MYGQILNINMSKETELQHKHFGIFGTYEKFFLTIFFALTKTLFTKFSQILTK